MSLSWTGPRLRRRGGGTRQRRRKASGPLTAGPGTYGLEVVYGADGSRPNTTTVREVWKGRHGHRAAPLLVVVSYSARREHLAVVCGPTGDDPRVVDLDHRQAERLAEAALGEPDRHLAICFLADALEGEPGEHPGLRNKGLLATHELLSGVPKRDDWAAATARSEPLLKRRGQDLVRPASTPATSPGACASASTSRSCRAWPSPSGSAGAGPPKKTSSYTTVPRSRSCFA